MIPKLIHYCWFGRGKMPEHLKQYMVTWKRILPDYKIMEWNEDNFDVDSSIAYVREAYAAQKFAFVSDYVRLKVLYDYGGIYLDTDIEMIKSPENLLKDASMVIGFETETKLITAFIASEKGNIIIADFLNRYATRHFLLENGDYDLTPINDKFTELLVQYGMKINNTRQSIGDGVEIYPYVVFCGQDIENSHLKIEESTCTIHRFQASWVKQSFWVRLKYRVIIRILQKILGCNRYDQVKRKLHL